MPTLRAQAWGLERTDREWFQRTEMHRKDTRTRGTQSGQSSPGIPFYRPKSRTAALSIFRRMPSGSATPSFTISSARPRVSATA